MKESRAWIDRQWQVLKDPRFRTEQVDRGASEDEAVKQIDLPQLKRFGATNERWRLPSAGFTAN
jgi:hypothetical protein